MDLNLIDKMKFRDDNFKNCRTWSRNVKILTFGSTYFESLKIISKLRCFLVKYMGSAGVNIFVLSDKKGSHHLFLVLFKLNKVDTVT